MNKLFLPFLFFACCCPSLLWGQQQPTLADLQAQLTNSPDDSTKAAVFLQLYKKIPRNQPDSLLQLAQQGAKFTEQHLNTYWGRKAYQKSLATIGFHYCRAGQFHLSEPTFHQLIAKGQELKDSVLISDGYSDLAYVFSTQEKDDSSIFYDLKALVIREAIGSPKVGASYNNLGYDYKVNGQLKKGLHYYQKAIAYKLQEGLENSLGNSYMNVGNIYQKLEVWDSALHYLHLALHNVQALEDSVFMAEALHNIGKTYLEAGNALTANTYLEQAMAIFEALQMHQHPRVVHTYHELARTKLALQQEDQAASLLATAKKILEDNDRGISHRMKYQLTIQEDLAWATADYIKAKLYAERKEALLDSLHSRELKQKKYQLLTEYEDKLKVERIKHLEQQQQIDQLEYEKINRQRLLLAGVLFLLVIVILLLYRINQWRSQINQELSTLNATKDKLFSIIAHDLKNPLSAFRSITQSLSDGIFDISREDLDYFIKQLNTSAHSLLELLQNLLYWSISQSGRLEFNPSSLQLRDNGQEVIQLLQSSATIKNITLENQLSEELQVWADHKMTKAILRNLLANALKFTPNGGTIQLEGKAVDQTVVISVQDTGTGVPPELVQHLFTLPPHQKRTTGTGTGLGLILCKELAEQQGGKIWLEQSSSKGSTFCFSLPIVP